MKKKKILAIIPARGGSKGLPGKNIKVLHGKPLLAWTIRAARASKYIDQVIVNTDSIEIQKVAQKWGADVPFLRPKKLATDKAKMKDVILDTMSFFENSGNIFDVIVLLQPTSPLRKAADIDGAIDLFNKRKASAVVSVCPCEHPPYYANTLPNNGSMKNFLSKKFLNKNRQDLPPFYRLNGAIYLNDWKAFKKQQGFLGDQTIAYVMPTERSIDIDTQLDFELCQLMMRSKR